MKEMNRNTAIYTFFLLFSVISHAQTCCTGGTPLLGAYVVSPVAQGDFGFHLTYNYNNNGDLILEDDEVAGSFITRNVNSFILQLDYGLSNSVSVGVVIPYLVQNETITGGGGDVVYENSGISDVSVWGKYQKSYSRHDLNFSLGLKIPTGTTNDRLDGIALPQSLQLGSGSLDFGVNVQSSYYLTSNKMWALENQISAKMNSKGQNFDVHPEYRFGNQFQFLSGVSYRYVISTLLSTSYVGAVFEQRGQDKFRGDFSNENTGGTWVNLSVGQNFSFSSRTKLGLNLLYPIHRDLNGLQLSTTWQGAIVFSYLIKKKNEELDSSFF